MALILWPNTGDGGPITAISGEVIMSELGQMSGFSIVLPAASERAILAMAPYTEIELEQAGSGVWGVGTIQRAIVVNPRQAITDRDEHTITLDLMPLTAELTWRTTRRGWTAENLLSIVHSRLVSLVPGWTGTFTGDPTDTVSGGDFTVSVNLNNPTVLAGDLQTGKQFGQFVRQGVDALGVPTRALEMGQFGAAPTITIQDPKGGSAEEMVGNLGVRPVVTVERSPNDVTTLVNVTTPFGGGSSAETVVTLERLWGILNDPLYLNYGRYGTDAESMARTGMATVLNSGTNPTIPALLFQAAASYSSATLGIIPLGATVAFLGTATGWSQITYNGVTGYVDARYLISSLFPEYDPAYPISDPTNPPTGVIQWFFVDASGTALASTTGFTVTIGVRGANGIVPLTVRDGTGAVRTDVFAELYQGAIGTRGVTVDGHFDYDVYGVASYAAYGHKAGDYTDSSLTYADNSVANQEYTERALYVSTKTNFLRRAHPHHTFSCTAPGTGRPTRAGDLIAVDVQRVSVGLDDGAAVVEMDVRENLKVMRVTRSFNGDAPPVDTYVVSNLGRFEDDDTTDGAGQAQTLVALQRQQGTGLSKDTYVYAGNIDAANPITLWHYISKSHFRYRQVRVRCDFFPFRGTATTAANIAGTPVVSADVELDIVTPFGLGAQEKQIGGMPSHYHKVVVDSALKTYSIPSVPINEAPTGYLWYDQTSANLKANSVSGSIQTGVPFDASVNLEPTKHTHVVADAGTAIAHIPAGQRLANLPPHTHDVEKRIPTGQPSPVSIAFSINGQGLSSGKLATGTRDTTGAFTSQFIVDDISAELDALSPGTDVPLRFDAGTSAGNAFGTGYVQITITAEEELGGLTSIARAS